MAKGQKRIAWEYSNGKYVVTRNGRPLFSTGILKECLEKYEQERRKAQESTKRKNKQANSKNKGG